MPQGLSDPRRHSGDARQRGGDLDAQPLSGSQAIILAGGEGTRLRPLTLTRAKPVVPLLNRPFLAYQLVLLHQHGVTDVVLACSYRVDDVRSALGDGAAYGVRLRYAIEGDPRGTGGGLRNAADLARGTVVVFNGDVLTDADLTAMARFHAARTSRTTIYLMRVADPRPYGLVEVAADGRIGAFREKPTTPAEITTDTVNAGIYMIDAELLARIPSGQVASLERDFFPALLRDGIAAYGWITTAYWRDIGNPRAYRDAQSDLLAQRVRTPLAPPGHARDGSWLADGVSLEADARVEAPSLIGPGVVIGAGARVGPHCVLGARCRIGDGAQLDGAVLWDDVTVDAGAVLRDCAVGAGARIGVDAQIGAGVTLETGAVIPDRARLAAKA
jgi:NDP-sugar pyrophosphorylase family protein